MDYREDVRSSLEIFCFNGLDVPIVRHGKTSILWKLVLDKVSGHRAS